MDESFSSQALSEAKQHFEALLLDPTFLKLTDRMKLSTSNFTTGQEDVDAFSTHTIEWLLNPNDNHGLRDLFLTAFLRLVAADPQITDFDPFDVLLMNTSSFWTTSTEDWIDICVISDSACFSLFIKNTVSTVGRSSQLQTCRKVAESKYPDYQRVFVLLSPHGEQLTDSRSDEGWVSISLSSVVDAMESSLETARYIGGIAPQTKLAISDYLNTIRRTFMCDDLELQKLCKAVYAKHRTTLNLLLAHRIDTCSTIRRISEKWLQETPGVEATRPSTDRCCYFITKQLHNRVCVPVEEGYNDYCGYEIVFEEHKGVFCIQLVFCNDDTRPLTPKEQAVMLAIEKNGGATAQDWWGAQYPAFTFFDVWQLNDLNPYLDGFEEDVRGFLDQSLASLRDWENRIAGKIGNSKVSG